MNSAKIEMLGTGTNIQFESHDELSLANLMASSHLDWTLPAEALFAVRPANIAQLLMLVEKLLAKGILRCVSSVYFIMFL